jgi:hypothetical protein
MSRDKQHAIRNALYQIETSIPKADRSQIAEWERDLIAVASCAVWDADLKKLHRCVRRLQGSPERRAQYAQVMDLLAA